MNKQTQTHIHSKKTNKKDQVQTHICSTHSGNEFVHAVGRHAMQVREMELQVNLVVEHVLAERTAEHGLDRVLRHHVHPESVQVSIGELAVGALVHLE